MKKNILSLILATTMTMSLVACGTAEATTTETTVTEEPVVESTETVEEVTTEEPVGYVKEVEEDVVEVSDEALNNAVQSVSGYVQFCSDFNQTQQWDENGFKPSHVLISLFTATDVQHFFTEGEDYDVYWSDSDNETLKPLSNEEIDNLPFDYVNAFYNMAVEIALQDYISNNIPTDGLNNEKYNRMLYTDVNDYKNVNSNMLEYYTHYYNTSDDKVYILSRKASSSDIYYNLLGACRVMYMNYNNFCNVDIKKDSYTTNIPNNYKVIKGWNDENIDIAFAIPVEFSSNDDNADIYTMNFYFDNDGNLITCDRNDEALWQYTITPNSGNSEEYIDWISTNADTMYLDIYEPNCEFIPDVTE